jgi:hypothetical protein
MSGYSRARIASAFIAMLGAAGCAAPQYDDQTDKMISTLQSDVDTQLVTLITLDHKIAALAAKSDAASQKALADATTKAGYDASSSFYDKTDVELTSLRLRVDAAPNNSTANIDTALTDLSENLLGEDTAGSLQNHHKNSPGGVMDLFYLTTIEKQLNAQFQALLSYELVLKGNSSSGGGSSSGSSGGGGSPNGGGGSSGGGGGSSGGGQTTSHQSNIE